MKNIYDVCTVERTKKGEPIPDGCYLIRLSASDGLVHRPGFTNPEGCAVVRPLDPDDYDYLQSALDEAFEKHYQRTNQGINYPFDGLKTLELIWPEDKKERQRVGAVYKMITEQEDRERTFIGEMLLLKQKALSTMFPG